MLDFFGFSIPIIYVHLGTLVCLIPLILYADHQAFAWITGSKVTLNGKALKLVHNLTGLGLLTMVLSGVAMSMSLLDYLLMTPAFLIKMGFVFALVVNSFFIGSLMHHAIERPFNSLSMKESFPLFISGAVSTLGWVGAFVAALFMGFNEISSLLNL